MRVVMHRANRALLEIHFHRHHPAVVRQNTTRHAVAQILKRGLFMENKHIFALLCNETLFQLIYLTRGEKETFSQITGKAITSLLHWVKRTGGKMKTIGLLGA